MIYKVEQVVGTKIPVELILEERVIRKYRKKKRIRATLEDSLERFDQYKKYLEESFNYYLERMCEISRIDLVFFVRQIRVLVIGRKEDRKNDILGMAFTRKNDLSNIKVMVSPIDKHQALIVLFHEIFHFVLDTKGKKLNTKQKELNHQIVYFFTGYKLSYELSGITLRNPPNGSFQKLDEAYSLYSLNAIQFRDKLLNLNIITKPKRVRKIPKDKREEVFSKVRWGKRHP